MKSCTKSLQTYIKVMAMSQKQQSIHGNTFIVKPLFLLYPVTDNYLYLRDYDLVFCFTSLNF